MPKTDTETPDDRAATTAAKGDPKYSAERLLASSSELFGQPAHALAGALALRDDDSDTLTVAEAKAALDKYLGK